MVYKSNSALGWGSIVISILTSTGPDVTTTYICESWTPVAPVEIAERKNQLNEPNGFVQVDQARTVSVVAQLATATTPVPARGAEFTVDTIVYVVGEVTTPKEQGGIWKFSFNAREKI